MASSSTSRFSFVSLLTCRFALCSFAARYEEFEKVNLYIGVVMIIVMVMIMVVVVRMMVMIMVVVVRMMAVRIVSSYEELEDDNGNDILQL